MLLSVLMVQPTIMYICAPEKVELQEPTEAPTPVQSKRAFVLVTPTETQTIHFLGRESPI